MRYIIHQVSYSPKSIPHLRHEVNQPADLRASTDQGNGHFPSAQVYEMMDKTSINTMYPYVSYKHTISIKLSVTIL